ncbi:UDP-2,3-diacylglucosamine diphosphatase [Gemmatimonas sp.]|uniref:UDP-2,3-diacylglucosamine diphosphatase n=1 Tax=Gemmatimonas sp. TaxID=1962908 RepID=UPI003DA3A734
MLPTPCHVIGDVHLGVASPESEQALLRLLRDVPSRARSVVIMGDLFDFWFAWESAMPRTGFRVLSALADLHDAGIPVLWIGGNHDCWGGDALQKETGAVYTLDPWRGRIGAWDAMLAHGDGLREVEDAPYRRLRAVLRHPWAIRAFGALHPTLATRIAMRSSKTSRKGRARDGGAGLLAVATAALTDVDGPQLVLHGHSHVPTLLRAGHGVYGNAGAWYLDRQYLVIDDEQVTRREWHPSGEHVVLDVAERPPQKATP